MTKRMQTHTNICFCTRPVKASSFNGVNSVLKVSVDFFSCAFVLLVVFCHRVLVSIILKPFGMMQAHEHRLRKGLKEV